MLALWALPEDVLEHYLVLKKPIIQDTGADVILGRAILPKVVTQQAQKSVSKKVGFHSLPAERGSSWAIHDVPQTHPSAGVCSIDRMGT